MKKLKISNVRIGLATNSSSSHSILILPPKTKVQDKDMENFYGWNFFTAAQRETKLDYFSHILFSSLGAFMADEYAQIITKDLLGIQNFQSSGGIDHQSLFRIPSHKERYSENHKIDENFMTEFREFLLREDVVIVGGNDNTDEVHSLAGVPGVKIVDWDYRPETNYTRARKDGKWWTLFTINGTKTRFSFDENAEDYTKATAPELVDIKITDWCGEGCAFCYQNSTPKGEHSEYSYIRNIAENLGDLGVFEVALGGGETTSHPDFVKILEDFRRKGIVPNFTTRSFTWLENEERTRAIMEHTGAFAFSVQSRNEIDKLMALTAIREIPKNKVNLHYVMGTQSNYIFRSILEAAKYYGIRITLLGYKEVGRGTKFKPHTYTYGSWIDDIQDVMKDMHARVSIDTALAKEFYDELLEKDVAKETFHTDEGKFSMYIDAVAGEMAKSSYEDCARTALAIGNRLDDQILQVFATY